MKDIPDDNSTDLGVNAGQNLRFGQIRQNANYTKWVSVSVKDRSRVELGSEGNISELLQYEKSMYVEGDERIAVKLFPSEEGYYEGRIELDIWRPKNELGRVYLRTRSRLEQLV